MYYIYAIYNRDHDKIYIGQTKDLFIRVKMHNEHVFRGYTSNFSGEWKLMYQEEAGNLAQVLKREKQLKSFRGREYIKSFIPR